MISFKYKAVSLNGQILEGYHKAQSKDEVLSMLKNNNYFPMSIEEDINTGGRTQLFAKKVSKKDMALFCRQFYTMLNAGVGIIQCLSILEKQTTNRTLKSTIGVMCENVQKGMSLSEGMRKNEKIFPPLLINMVEAGEVSGNLDVIMGRMAVHFEKEYNIENKIKNALVYPIALSVIAIAVVVFLLTVVMPTFVGMFESSGVALPTPTRVMLTISDLLTHYWYIFIGLIILLMFGLMTAGRTDGGRMLYDTLKIKMPIIRNMNIKIVVSRFTRTLSTLLSSGIPLLQALDVVAKVVNNKIIEEQILLGKEDIRKGVPLSRSIRDMKLFPPMVDSMISIGEESGALDDILYKTADFYDEEVEASMQKMITLLDPLLIVFMSLIISLIVLAMALPLFEMVNTIQF